MKDKTKIKEPKIGDKIYVPSSYCVYRGEDDFEGGLATINKVEFSKHLSKDHFNYTMVGIEGRPSTMYNYRVLMEEQDELKKEYEGKVAHSNPDLRPEFNEPNADWKYLENQETQELKKLNKELYKEFQDLRKQVDKLTEKIFPTAIPSYGDWDIESPENIEVCKKCGGPTEIVVSSKTDPCALYRCFCNADFSDINNPFEGLKSCTKIDGNFNLKFRK